MSEPPATCTPSQPPQSSDESIQLVDPLRTILREYWGYDDFRPLQAEAMRAVVEGRDSLVVLPTGGGKSLCFQAPALAMPGLAVVVSPLISLMKDQVDALVDCGVRAACVNSTLTPAEKREIADEIKAERLKLLYLSPERLLTDRTLDFLQQVPLSFIAIDEAHCISEWGHDFRPEYRGLRVLKDRFPNVALHTYTATATPHVRDDIVRELGLREPEVLVGSFDRPNLIYRVRRRSDLLKQIREVIDRHADEPGLIYCIRRTDVEEIAAQLTSLGYQALPYHAGMSDEDRRRNQDAFINDRCRIIVATVAFGMGIDKSNVRYVIHAAAPKSLESYQQESGRVGRDGLEAECWLFHSAGDFQLWRRLQRDLPPARIRDRRSSCWPASTASPTASPAATVRSPPTSAKSWRSRTAARATSASPSSTWSTIRSLSRKRSSPASPASTSATAATTWPRCWSARAKSGSSSAATTSSAPGAFSASTTRKACGPGSTSSSINRSWKNTASTTCSASPRPAGRSCAAK